MGTWNNPTYNETSAEDNLSTPNGNLKQILPRRRSGNRLTFYP